MIWLTLFSSIASILSLFVSFFEYFKKWRSYLLYFFCITAGMSIGIFLSMSESGVRQFTTSQLIYIIALVSLVSFLVFFVYRFLTQANESLFTTVITFIAISYFIPQIMSSVEKSQNFIQPVDYYILFKHYESKNDFIRAADYLKRYQEMDNNNIDMQLNDSLTFKIKQLRFNSIRR